MSTQQPPALLEQLRHPSSITSQVESLRTLKHELIGHDELKETWITWGLVPLLSEILQSRRVTNRKKAVTPAQLNGSRSHGVDVSRPQTDEEEGYLQAVIIVGSLAQGGPAFVTPLLSGGIVPSLLSVLSSPDGPVWLIRPILTTLNAIAERLPLQNEDWPQENKLAELIFTPEYIGLFPRIFSLNSSSRASQESINLTAGLITRLCTEETQKSALASCGALDALALKLASFVVSQGFVLPGAEDHLGEPGALSAIPPPAPSGLRLSLIMRAIAVIIEPSAWRAEHFLSSPGIVTVFPKHTPQFSPTDIKKAPWGSTYLSGYAVPRQIPANPIDSILPAVPQVQTKASTNFPPLVPQGSFNKRRPSYLETSSSEEEENAIIPWLFHVIRDQSGMTRLMAARLVTVLFRAGLAKKQRLSMLSYLLVPILLRMFDKEYDMKDEEDPQYDGLIPTTLRMKEEAPAVLATLVMDKEELQKHAVEGDAIKKLSQLLKETYNPVPDTPRAMWHADGEHHRASGETQAQLQLGPPGISPIVAHVVRYRENILRALAALAPDKDEYRKVICNNGVVTYIIDALKPRNVSSAEDPSHVKNTAVDGNPVPTILAACGAARMLTRSVSVLRTSLIDAGVAAPLFELIKHPDVEVQIAATAVICNLALDFSPMKEAIISADILPVLCDHCHSAHTRLRLESLWALKHVVYNSADDIKSKIIGLLGPAWLKEILMQDPTAVLSSISKRAIDSDTDNGSLLGTFSMGSSNAVGEQVNLLNPMDDVRDQNDLSMSDNAISRNNLEQFLPDPARRRKLVLGADFDQKKQAREAEIGVQEQAFDLIRNILCGPDAAQMVDYLQEQFGYNVLLDIMAEKLRPRAPTTGNRRESVNYRPAPVAPEILIAVTYVIVHIAASVPRHRDQLLAHPELIKNLMTHFNHSNRYVRVNCVWVVINLTWREDKSEQQGCRERALQLGTMGVMDRLASLQEDTDLDVKERVKVAQHWMRSLV